VTSNDIDILDLVTESIHAVFSPELAEAIVAEPEVLETLAGVLGRRSRGNGDAIDQLLDAAANAIEIEPDEHGMDGLRKWMISHPQHAAKKLITVLRDL
jgi:hypothetical protein